MSRDGNGNYTLPLGAVATGEVIASTWANTSLDDIAAAMTDSLARSGNGGMLAPFRATDGTINAPSLSFNNETNSGVYRSSAGDYRLCVNGKDKARIRDVNGMAAFQVFDLAGTGAWETLAKAADVAALSLANVLAIGNTTGGTDIVLTDGDVITGTADPVIKPPLPTPGYGAPGIELQSSAGVGRITTSDLEAKLWYGATSAVSSLKLSTTDTGIDVSGTVDADGFSGTSTVTITDFVTDVSTNNNDTTVPTTAAVKSYADATGGNETLAQTLALGNITDGTDLSVSASDDLLLTDTSKIIASNGLTGTSKREFQLYVDGAANGIVKLKVEGNKLSITSDSTVSLDAQGGWPLVKATQVNAILSYGAGAGSNLVKLETTTTGVDVTGTVVCDGVELSSGSNIFPTAGSLNLKAAVGGIIYLNSSGDARRVATSETGVSLSHGATAAVFSTKLETTATGVDVTGTVKCDGVELSTGDEVYTTAGSLNLRGAASTFLLTSSGSQRVSSTETGVSLFYGATAADSDVRLATTDIGATVTGKLTVTDRVTADEIAAPNSYVNSTAAVMLNAQNWNGQQVWNKHNGNSTLTLPTDVQATVGFSTTISVMSSGFTMTLTPDSGDIIKYLDPLTSTWSGTVNADLVVGSGGVIELMRTAVSEWTVYGSGVV